MSITSSTPRKIPFIRSQKKVIHVFIAGVGAIGGTLIQLIKKLNNEQFHVHISGVCNSRKVIWEPDLESIAQELSASTEETNWDTITDTLIQYSDDFVFIDATGSEIAARQYLKLLSHGVHVTTPSKRANTFEQSYFDELITFPTHGLAEYKYETAVGAGLPVINTLQNLIDTGDTVTKISGVVSGTMTYIFNQLQQGRTFSTIIKSAKSEGYSEPDPRDDLSGEDVARKFLILARTCGYTFERDQIQVESLVPGKFDDLSVEQFLDSISEVDEDWEKRNAAALHQNKRLRYTGEFTSDTITIGIEEVDADSPLGGLQGTDNLIQIYTERYATSPIVIQGPGAGKEVTAAGVLSDVLQIGKNI